MASKQGLYASLRSSFPGVQVEIPYKQRMKDLPIDELALSVRASNGLMRANAGTFGRLWDLMAGENGLRAVRNLGEKSEREIKRCFFDACYHFLSINEQAIFWQNVLNISNCPLTVDKR